MAFFDRFYTNVKINQVILIDALYLNSFGGKTILELIIQKVINSNMSFHFLIDKRLNSHYLKFLNSKDYTIIKASHSSRRFYYQKKKNTFSSILCLSNIPPPIKTHTIKTTIFFHNQLLLNSFKYETNIKSKIINQLKFFYINYYNNNDYNWITQTNLIKSMVHNHLKINLNKVSVFPIFENRLELNKIEKTANSLVYVSSGVTHKNHIRLIKAFIKTAKNTDKEVKLHLTLNKEELPKYIYPQNLKVKFHGTLSIEDVNLLYNSCEFAIYPSLVESFGLPLIEAANHGCKVIASDLPYVHEIIKPSLTFDPYSIESMADAILNAIDKDSITKTKVLVENKLDNFIKFIISQDVQK